MKKVCWGPYKKPWGTDQLNAAAALQIVNRTRSSLSGDMVHNLLSARALPSSSLSLTPTLVQADDGSQHLSGVMVQNITSLKSPKLRWEARCCGQSGPLLLRSLAATKPARFEHLMDARAAGCGVQWVCV